MKPPLEMGCQNNPCDILGNADGRGQCTNGRCRCDERKLRRGLRWYREQLQEAEKDRDTYKRAYLNSTRDHIRDITKMQQLEDFKVRADDERI